MNSYFQVARSYWRLRFQIFAGLYAFAIWCWWYWGEWGNPARSIGQVVASTFLAAIVGCFIALHVRRQFGNVLAGVLPGYAAPHLAIGLFASAILWFIAPGVLIWIGHWPKGALAAHAIAGILIGAVAIWPKSLMLLLTLPALLIWSSRWQGRGKTLLERFIDGELVDPSVALIVLAVAAHAVAVFVLLRIPRWGVSTSDELVLEPTMGVQTANPLGNWLLAARDRASDRLAETRFLRSIQRWRVPVAISWTQLAAPVLAVIAICAVGWLYDSLSGSAYAAILLVPSVLVIFPYGPWHVRRGALAVEAVRPVARHDFFRQIALAIALDVCVWMLLASIISVCVSPLARDLVAPEGRHWRFIAGQLAVLWSIALFVYGVALSTIRFRFWLPMIVVITFAWLIGIWWLFVWVIEHWRPVNMNRIDSLYVALVFAMFSAYAGACLAFLAYRRWLRMDLN
jgi:hypothetical protein